MELVPKNQRCVVSANLRMESMDQKNNYDPGSYNHRPSVLTLHVFLQPLNSSAGEKARYTRQAKTRD